MQFGVYLAGCLQHSWYSLIQFADQLEEWVIWQVLQSKVALQHTRYRFAEVAKGNDPKPVSTASVRHVQQTGQWLCNLHCRARLLCP